ncbi:MAG TPA: ATP-binding protein [bacterium]|nr:ATP-binding protein [bacterium]
MPANYDKNPAAQILIIAMLTAGVMILFEFIKTTWWPDLGMWPSHIATIIFITLCAVFASLSVIAKERQLRRQTEMALSWREEAESLVASSDRARRMIFDGVYDAVIIHNAAGIIIDINQSTLDLFQADSQHMIGGWIQDFFVPIAETTEPLTEIWDKVLRGEEQLFHYQARRPSDSSVFDVEVFLRRIQLGEKDLLLANIRDLTELKRMEEFAHLQEQKLIQADKMASLGVLVSGMAHEINNPNNYVLLNARVLSKAWNDIQPIVEEYYEANGDFAIAGMPYSSARDRLGNLYKGITEGAIRIERIVQHLKDFARQTSDHVFGEVDVNLAVETSVEILRGLIQRSTERFELDCAADLPKLHGNAVHLEQVLVNLITNACQALRSNQEGIRVVTRWESRSESIILSVTDEGEGITGDNLQHIMDPFYTTKREHGGTGLGLSISYNLIKNFGGELKISSTPGCGTSVEVRLPVTTRPAEGVKESA